MRGTLLEITLIRIPYTLLGLMFQAFACMLGRAWLRLGVRDLHYQSMNIGTVKLIGRQVFLRNCQEELTRIASVDGVSYAMIQRHVKQVFEYDQPKSFHLTYTWRNLGADFIA